MGDSNFNYIDELYKAQISYRNETKKSAISTRITWLKKLKSAILQKEQEIKSAIYQDFRKNPVETETTEILASILEINLFIKNLSKWAKPISAPTSLLFATTSAKLIYEPKGNALIITPWNYPFQLPMVHLIASIAAGNTTILKLSEFTPHINTIIKDLISNVFSPLHVAVIEGDVPVTTYLLSLKFDHIHFTGSPAVGKIIMEAAAKHLTDVTLELGGKSAVFIDKTVNIRQVAKNLIWAKFVNMGQTCIAPDYLLVDQSIEKDFDKVLKEEIESAFGKNPVESPDLARIINAKQFERLEHYLLELKDTTVEYIVSGVNEKSSLFIAPTVVKNFPLDSKLMQEEIFGPILPIVYYSDIQKALEIVNQKEKPLALYIFSQDKNYIDHVLNNTTAGGTTINDAMIHIIHPNLPFGGVNNSGIGQSLGQYGFKSFSHERATLQANYFPMSKFFWYPYTPKTKKLIQYIKKLFT